MIELIESIHGYNDMKRALNTMLTIHKSIPLQGGAIHVVRDNTPVVSIALPEEKTDPEGTLVCITLETGDILLASKEDMQNLTEHILENNQPWHWGDIEFSLVPKYEH